MAHPRARHQRAGPRVWSPARCTVRPHPIDGGSYARPDDSPPIGLEAAQHIAEHDRDRPRLVLTRVLVGSPQAAHRWMTTHGIRPASKTAPLVVNTLEAVQRKAIAGYNPAELSIVYLHDADPSVRAHCERLAGQLPA